MTNKEKDACTYIGSASIKLENTERRDKLVKAAEKAGFKVDCSEAIDVSFSGASTQPYWSITVYWPVKLDRIEKVEAKRKLANAWESL